MTLPFFLDSNTATARLHPSPQPVDKLSKNTEADAKFRPKLNSKNDELAANGEIKRGGSRLDLRLPIQSCASQLNNQVCESSFFLYPLRELLCSSKMDRLLPVNFA